LDISALPQTSCSQRFFIGSEGEATPEGSDSFGAKSGQFSECDQPLKVKILPVDKPYEQTIWGGPAQGCFSGRCCKPKPPENIDKMMARANKQPFWVKADFSSTLSELSTAASSVNLHREADVYQWSMAGECRVCGDLLGKLNPRRNCYICCSSVCGACSKSRVKCGD
jgi:hypothetical protein